MEQYVINMINQKIDLKKRTVTRAKDSVPVPAQAFDSREDTALYWLTGGGFLLNSRGTILMVDPVMEHAPGEPRICETGQKLIVDLPLQTDQVPRCDAVLYTHSDLDHVGSKTSWKLALKHVRRIAPAPVAMLLVEYGADPGDISVCRSGERYEAGKVRIEIIPSDHPWQLIDRKKYGRPFRGDDTCGFVVRTLDGSFMFTGDTRLMEEHLDVKDVDVLLVDTCPCIFHLNREGAIILSNAHENAYLIPYHYGCFDEPEIPAQENGDPALVFDSVRNADKRARILAPGEPFILRNRKEA